MSNPIGFLYRVGRSAARRYQRPQAFLPAEPVPALPHFEPSLVPALEALTEPQRVGVVLVHALGWTLADTAAVLDVEVSTLRTHIARGMTKLRTALQVDAHAN